MKKIVLLTLILFVFACSVKTAVQQPPQSVQSKDEAAKKEKHKKELEQVVNDARPIINNLLDSINNNDYEKYIKDFNSSMQSAYADKKQFRQINEERINKWGPAGARPIKRIEKKRPYYNLYYLVKFAKVAEPVPVFLSLKKQNGKLKVAFLQFQFSAVEKKAEPEP